VNSEGEAIIERLRPTMYFVGVTTGGSSINDVFPRWADILGLKGAQLLGVDLPIHAPPEEYRRVVRQIREDPLSLGALVTTHKLDLLRAAHDLFDELDRYAQLCNEVSGISKREGRVRGHAKDPITSGIALEEIIEPGHWASTGGEVMCLGAGGAGVAITTYFATRHPREDRPPRMTLIDIEPSRLENVRALLDRIPDPGMQVELVLNAEAQENDRRMGALPAGSLVINATGMGKDIPGSPTTVEAIFPEEGIAWELNYRGELDFLRQARAQVPRRNLRVHDGWHYFVVGWAEIIAEVFDVKLTPQILEHLEAAAEAARP
jgi:shikimate dehydrogenase